MSEIFKASNSHCSWPPSVKYPCDGEKVTLHDQKPCPLNKDSFKKYLSFFYTWLQKENTKKIVSQTSSQKLVDLKTSGLEFFWNHD